MMKARVLKITISLTAIIEALLHDLMCLAKCLRGRFDLCGAMEVLSHIRGRQIHMFSQ